MMLLTEISLMPGETVLKAGEISRKLSFVRYGSLNVTDARGTLVELIIGEVRPAATAIPPPNHSSERHARSQISVAS